MLLFYCLSMECQADALFPEKSQIETTPLIRPIA